MNKRFYNYAEAVDYFGAARKWFDAEIREYVDWQQAGVRKLVARVDLDRAWDEYVARRQGGRNDKKQEGPWAEDRPASTKTKRTARGKSTKSGSVVDFEAAFERVTKRKLGSSAGSPS